MVIYFSSFNNRNNSDYFVDDAGTHNTATDIKPTSYTIIVNSLLTSGYLKHLMEK
jgi:hypothetical protein